MLPAVCLMAVITLDNPPALAEGVQESQVSLALERQGKRIQMQGTVIAKGEAGLTILTAAHGIGPDDAGSAIRVRRGEGSSPGRVVRVDRNPHYRPGTGDIPGADNAYAVVRIEEGGTLDLDALRPAEVARFAIPDPNGQVVTAQLVDQFGKPHILRAGNFTNPKWLEWGTAYRPVAGDSGSGVFVLRTRPDGTVGPVLVGVVVNQGPGGGGASLVHIPMPARPAR